MLSLRLKVQRASGSISIAPQCAPEPRGTVLLAGSLRVLPENLQSLAAHERQLLAQFN